MKLIINNPNGQVFTVYFDDCDYELISKHKWWVNPRGYVKGTTRKQIYMHRLILGVTDPKISVDHKNHNKLDNRRSNIRQCTHRENMLNKKPLGLSKYLGVYTIVNYGRNNNGKRYEYIAAQIKINGKNKYLGSFKTEDDAARAYDAAAKVHHGEFANLNFK